MPSKFCKKAGICKHEDWCADDVNFGDNCEWFEEKTRYDKLHAMNPQELAEWIDCVVTHCDSKWKSGWTCPASCPLSECCNNPKYVSTVDWLMEVGG